MTTQSTCNVTKYSNWIPEPKISIYIRIGLTVLIFLMALVGNIMVLRAMNGIIRRKPFVYKLVANLAVGELGHIILTPILLHYEETHWRLGGVLCKMVNPLQNVFLTNVTLTMGAIAVYRCRVVYLSSSSNALSTLKSNVLLGSFWCIGIAVALPSSITREVVFCTKCNPSMLCCREMWNSEYVEHVFTMVRFTVMFWGPFAVMIVAYALVAMTFYQHRFITKKRCSIGNGFSTSCAEVEGAGDPPLELDTRSYTHKPTRGAVIPKARARILEMESNLLRMMYVIVLSFIICYIPYHIVFILHKFNIYQQWKYGKIFSMWSLFVLTSLPSALHPLFYGTKSKFFARAFYHLLTCQYRQQTYT